MVWKKYNLVACKRHVWKQNVIHPLIWTKNRWRFEKKKIVFSDRYVGLDRQGTFLESNKHSSQH